MKRRAKSKVDQEATKEVIANEVTEPEPEVEPKVRPTIHMKPEEIESRRQAFLEKIKHGGK